MSFQFLTAAWKKLAVANYTVSPEVLLPYLPFGTELDLWEGKCYVSLVGFMFEDVRVLNVPVPFHRNFEEVNLRFYVKRKVGDTWRRGVVFVKEIVPKFMVAMTANVLYKEHYISLDMHHFWDESGEARVVEYGWEFQDKDYVFRVLSNHHTMALTPESDAEFILEHYWGYTRISATETTEYEVGHPKWEVYPVLSYNIECDFGALYGAEFAHLTHQKPDSVFLAEGSEIFVKGKQTLGKGE